jgi:hypothetical protein
MFFFSFSFLVERKDVGWEQYVLTLQLIIFIQNNEEENLAV